MIVQGAVSEFTPACLKSIRASFPAAEIILSTWEGTDVSGLVADKFVFSDDPGSQTGDEQAGIPNNVNRQIISTQAGIAYASGKYILKTRTDILIESGDFVSYFGKYDFQKSSYFENRILISNFYSRSPRSAKICFHPSDWMAFGNADDIRKYYNYLNLQSEEDANWFKTHDKKESVYLNFICRYTPEQFIFLQYIKQFCSVDFEYHCYVSRNNIVLTEKLFAECFVVLDYGKELKIRFAKYSPNRVREKHTLISHRLWKALFTHYCEDKHSFYWFWYLLVCRIDEIISILRHFTVRILTILGIKESLKRFLGIFGYGK